MWAATCKGKCSCDCHPSICFPDSSSPGRVLNSDNDHIPYLYLYFGNVFFFEPDDFHQAICHHSHHHHHMIVNLPVLPMEATDIPDIDDDVKDDDNEDDNGADRQWTYDGVWKQWFSKNKNKFDS